MDQTAKSPLLSHCYTIFFLGAHIKFSLYLTEVYYIAIIYFLSHFVLAKYSLDSSFILYLES